MPTTYLRQDQASITVDLPGLPSFASTVTPRYWATLEGGDLESEDTKTRPGGMLPQVNLGGPTTRTDCTVTRPYTAEIHPFLTQLEALAGQGIVNVKFTVLQGNATTFPNGTTVTMQGILKNVTRPNFDANASGTAMLSLVIGMNVANQSS